MTALTLAAGGASAPTVVVDTRPALVWLASEWIAASASERAARSIRVLVDSIRVFAPKLADRTDRQVLEAFECLCEDVAKVAEFENGELTWDQVVDREGSDLDGQAAKALHDGLMDTLRTLTGVTGC